MQEVKITYPEHGKKTQTKENLLKCITRGHGPVPREATQLRKGGHPLKYLEGEPLGFTLCVASMSGETLTFSLAVCSGIRCLCRTPLVARDQAPCSHHLAVKIWENVFIFSLNLYSSNLMFYNMYLGSSKCMWHIYIYYITYICYILHSELFSSGRKIRQVYTNMKTMGSTLLK